MVFQPKQNIMVSLTSFMGFLITQVSDIVLCITSHKKKVSVPILHVECTEAFKRVSKGIVIIVLVSVGQ